VQSIIIIGAGAAGLMAAKQLSQQYHIILLEADSRLGGRMHTIIGQGFTGPVEAGAEFIHGNLAITMQLLEEAGIEMVETGGEMYSAVTGRDVETGFAPDGWQDLLLLMNTLTEDTSLDDFLNKYYGEEKHAVLRSHARGFAQGYDLADPAKVSVFFLRDEWEEGWEEQYHITGGYGKLVEYMEAVCVKNGCKIVTGAAVSQINWANNTVTVLTADGRQYHAQKAIITVPVSILQSSQAPNSLQFVPAINSYIQAAGHIGYGGVIKIALEFKTAFWNEDKPGMGFLFCDALIPTWWTQAPDNTPVITGWFGGPNAEAYKDAGEDELLQKGLQSLASAFGMAVSQLEAALVAGKVFNWVASPFSQGAYSYATPLTAKALEILNTPVDNTLYFAGEALYTGPHPGTVEAALVSGKEVADKIMRVL
jgi:monoamine oxidase